MARPSPDQTARSATTAGELAERDELAVRWVFPTYDRVLTELGETPIVLGRDAACDVTLPGKETSRRHAEIQPVGPLYVVRDLGSTNGVLLNGQRVEHAVLSAGDVLRLGDWIGVVVGPENGPSSAFEVDQGMLVGPVLRPVLELGRRAARAGLSTVMEGETGTGKELLARALHTWSDRTGPLVAINCAALPESLAEAELFGHAKGAFTGAARPSLGKIRAADGGTLLLDEVSRLSLPLQAKLLRVLDQREVLPLGESAPVAVDVVVLAATQQPLNDLVLMDRFARDLQMRLEGATLRLPPLRERRQEMGYLVAELAKKHAKSQTPALDAKLVEALCLYAWPGNLRELDQLVRRLVSLYADQPRLGLSHLPQHMLPRSNAVEPPSSPASVPSGAAGRPSAPFPDAQGATEPLTRQRLERVLRDNSGNIRQAATELGIRRQDFYRFFSKAELEALRRAGPK
ncbi:MAG: sigma 54-interacting transcriptional regulator [Polyangiaceae bacterium]|nr:sigma 54-interacting transcriptional regulator [Polyangiaceae bacterium]